MSCRMHAVSVTAATGGDGLKQEEERAVTAASRFGSSGAAGPPLPHGVVASYAACAGLRGELGLLLDALAMTTWPMAQLSRICHRAAAAAAPASPAAPAPETAVTVSSPAQLGPTRASGGRLALVATRPPYEYRLLCPVYRPPDQPVPASDPSVSAAVREQKSPQLLSVDVMCTAAWKAWLRLAVIVDAAPPPPPSGTAPALPVVAEPAEPVGHPPPPLLSAIRSALAASDPSIVFVCNGNDAGGGSSHLGASSGHLFRGAAAAAAAMGQQQGVHTGGGLRVLVDSSHLEGVVERIVRLAAGGG